MGVNSLPKTVTRQRRDCDLNPGPSVPDHCSNHSAIETLDYRVLYLLTGVCVCSGLESGRLFGTGQHHMTTISPGGAYTGYSRTESFSSVGGQPASL